MLKTCYENHITEVISIQFEDEPASADGIFREAYSAFYRDLFQSSGIDAYVPMSLSASQAKCLGRILTRAFIQSNVFPVNISKACFEYAIFGLNMQYLVRYENRLY